MSLKLRASRLYTPRSVLERELDRVAKLTIAALDGLLEEHVPEVLPDIRSGDPPYKGHLEDRRRAMAEAHRRRVAPLVATLGKDEAITKGREVMFPVGQRLGAEARARFGLLRWGVPGSCRSEERFGLYRRRRHAVHIA